jgi:hypothetical protein
VEWRTPRRWVKVRSSSRCPPRASTALTGSSATAARRRAAVPGARVLRQAPSSRSAPTSHRGGPSTTRWSWISCPACLSASAAVCAVALQVCALLKNTSLLPFSFTRYQMTNNFYGHIPMITMSQIFIIACLLAHWHSCDTSCMAYGWGAVARSVAGAIDRALTSCVHHHHQTGWVRTTPCYLSPALGALDHTWPSVPFCSTAA